MIGLDYASPILYHSGKSGEGEAYVILYSCSLTRDLYLELLKDMTTEQFTQNFKRLVARKGKPVKVYEKIRTSCTLLDKTGHRVTVQPPQTTWWGGQLERLIGLMKKLLFKVTGEQN